MLIASIRNSVFSVNEFSPVCKKQMICPVLWHINVPVDPLPCWRGRMRQAPERFVIGFADANRDVFHLGGSGRFRRPPVPHPSTKAAILAGSTELLRRSNQLYPFGFPSIPKPRESGQRHGFYHFPSSITVPASPTPSPIPLSPVTFFACLRPGEPLSQGFHTCQDFLDTPECPLYTSLWCR